tara:strand:+ start:811 stop:1344 length:534 start_codon:yes stop_codon:yes gene_type:complete
VSACGGSDLDAAVGTGRAAGAVRPIEMTFRTTTGEWVHLGDLRGKPVLLFLMATFDGVSQAALRPVSRFVRHRGEELHVLGVAVQPNPHELLAAYVNALEPPFPFVYEANQTIGEGTSPLGDLPGIPMFVMIDAHGQISGQHQGFPNTDTLPILLDDAIDRGGIRETPGPTPLIGQD